MPHYRCYLFSETNHMLGAETITVDVNIRADEIENAALEQARELLRAKHAHVHAVEVWDRTQLVGRIENPPATSHSALSLA